MTTLSPYEQVLADLASLTELFPASRPPCTALAQVLTEARMYNPEGALRAGTVSYDAIGDVRITWHTAARVLQLACRPDMALTLIYDDHATQYNRIPCVPPAVLAQWLHWLGPLDPPCAEEPHS